MGRQMMAIVCTRLGMRGKVYLSADDFPEFAPDNAAIRDRIEALCRRTGLTVPSEPIINDAKNALFCVLYGLKTWGDLFTPRQMLCLMTFAAAVREAEEAMEGYEVDRRKAIVTCLGGMVDRLGSFSSTQCVWLCVEGERTANTFGRQALPMVWDFSETAPFNEQNAGWPMALDRVIPAIESASVGGTPVVSRGSAAFVPWPDGSFDAVITDPPYYDNVPYADLSDFFYVWLKRTVGHIYSEHFAAQGTPKKAEAVADATRHGGSKEKARHAYEDMMAQSFLEAHRVLKTSGQLVVVYAHKTTLGWSTLVDALRSAGFTVTEAWPLDTEKPGRLRAQASAALASSIFLVARKRGGGASGYYQEQVRPELEAIVRERVGSLWDQGVSGADLVIACVGAGLRAFTRFERIEYANGEEVPAQRFLMEVETAVLEAILARLSKEAGANGGRYSLAGLDAPTRFYILWRYTYRSAELDAGEAIIFANGTHVELDGPNGLSTGSNALLEKKKGKYRLRDFTERGDDEDLGLPENGTASATVDILHRLLWLLERRLPLIPRFLADATPSLEQLKLIAQSLAGPALKGGELKDISPTAEQSALGRLLANWHAVMEGPEAVESRRAGQQKLI
jgi:putative DNA methylase